MNIFFMDSRDYVDNLYAFRRIQIVYNRFKTEVGPVGPTDIKKSF